MDGKIYQFEGYLLDVAEQRLQKDGQDIQMPPKVFEVLTAFLRRHGQLITYQELMDEVWPETFVEETNLRYSVHALRKTLPESFIETVPKRGYRFRAEVKSFTKEEFIKIHTGSFKKDALPIPSDETAVRKNAPTVFRKYLPVAAVALVMTGIGLAAFYLWPKNDVLSGKTTKTVAVVPFKIVGEESEPNRNLQKICSNRLFSISTKLRICGRVCWKTGPISVRPI